MIKYVRKRLANQLKNDSIKSGFSGFLRCFDKKNRILTTAYKVAADKSADAIFKVLSILAPVFSSLTVQDGGENALRTKTSFLWL